MNTRFYIEYAQDEHGNTCRTKAIIECELLNIYHPSIGHHLKVIGPDEYARKWPTLLTMHGLYECPANFGPARMLTHAEHKKLWEDWEKAYSN